MSKIFIGIDNGGTGSIGIITPIKNYFFLTPTFSQQNYTKAKANITRVDVITLRGVLDQIRYDTAMLLLEEIQVHCIIERPMVNPSRFQATTSALRALEATLNVIELLGFSYSYVDSKEWQKVLLPSGSTKEELKKDSMDIGCRMFPEHKELIVKHKDADGMLMAEYCRRKFK